MIKYIILQKIKNNILGLEQHLLTSVMLYT